MGLWTKEQLRAFIKENKLVTAQDAQNALKERFAETLQEMPPEIRKLIYTTNMIELPPTAL